MKLNHLNLCVVDVPASVTFFETYFGFRCLEEKGAGALAVLEDDDGFTLILSNLRKAETPVYPTDFHIGFILKDAAEVQATYGRLQQGGVDLQHAPRRMHGSIGFYGYAPGQLLFEVSALQNADSE